MMVVEAEIVLIAFWSPSILGHISPFREYHIHTKIDWVSLETCFGPLDYHSPWISVLSYLVDRCFGAISVIHY